MSNPNTGVVYVEGNPVKVLSLLGPNDTAASAPKVIDGNVREQIMLANPLTGEVLDFSSLTNPANTPVVAVPVQTAQDTVGPVIMRVDGAPLRPDNGKVLVTRNPSLPAAGYPVLAGSAWTDVSTGVGVVGAVSNSLVNCTVTPVSRLAADGKTVLYGVRIQATGGTACLADWRIRPQTFPAGRLTTLAYADSTQTLVNNQLSTLLSDSDAFSNYFSTVYLRDYVGWWHINPNSPSAPGGKWAIGAGSPIFGTTSFERVRFRMDYTSGQLPWVELYGVFYAPDVTKPRISFTADDGYAVQYQYAAPLLEKYGFRGSFGIIADAIGQGGNMTLANLQDLVARGHECVVHGPIGGTGSLLNYTNDPNRAQEVYNDVKFHRDFLVTNNLAKNGSERIYVFPQGFYEFSTGDPTILNQIISLGFVGGRGTNQSGLDNKRSRYGETNWGRNIIGHLWTSSGAEAANITAIVARIATGIAEKSDMTMMNHKFSPNASADSLTIKNSDYETILAAAADAVAAGTLDNVLLSQAIFEGNAVPQFLSV